MLIVALSFTRHTTLRMQEIAGGALTVGGALNFVGSSMPFGGRGGQALGGLAIAAAGVLLILAFHYGAP
jgi:hypothetical protein